MIWSNPGPELGRLLVCVWLWVSSSALHSLVTLAELPADRRWMDRAAPLALYAATALATAMIYEWVPNGEYVGYVLATLYILATLASLAVLVTHVMHLRTRTPATSDALSLVLVDGDVYEDPRSARRYRVLPLN
jgi:hypothetical protein